MSRKSKGKKKKHGQKEAPKIPPQQSPPTVAKSGRHGILLTAVGLVLTAIGLVALIELFPRLSVAASSPTDPDDQLTSSKFTVSNDGYLKVTNIMAACFMWKVELGPMGKPNAHIRDSLASLIQPPESMLRPTEGFTVPCTGSHFVGASPPYIQPVINFADLAIVVYYRVWPFTFYRDHRLFRFVADVEKEKAIVWEKQPAAILEPDFDKWITEHGGVFPPKFPIPMSQSPPKFQ